MTRYYWTGGNRSHEQDRFFEESLDPSLWQKAEGPEQWDACWYTGMPDPEYFSEVGPGRTINHIPGNNALTVKSRLYQSLMSLRDRVQRQEKGGHHLSDRLAFVPQVFAMPADYHAFQEAALANPEKRWILKPKNAARGKGIQLVDDPADVPVDSSWMVQEYLENPHTMHGRKYVLRLYVLVSSISPFRVYLYRQGFAKLASMPYDEENANNPYSYLTNPDVNALNLDAEVPVEFVDFERYRAWLREQGHDDDALFARIEDMVALTCLSALEPMRERSRVVGADTRGCYELMGIDCLIDQDLKPWVLECNLSPSLEVCAGPESGGDVEEGIKGSIVADMVEMLGLNRPPAGDTNASGAEQVVRETQDEIANSGGFRNLIPGSDPSSYLPFMALPRLSDWVVAQALCDKPLKQPCLERWCAEETFSEDQVYLYDTRLGHLSSLNETASLIWLMATEGAGPDDIASALVDSAAKSMPTAPDAWAIRNDVWNTLADWVNNRFLVQSDGQPTDQGPSESGQSSLSNAATVMSMVVSCGRFRARFLADSAPLVHRIGKLLEPMTRPDEAPNDSLPRLEVVRDTPGFTLILEGQVIRSRLPLAEVVPAIVRCFATQAATHGDIAMDAGLIGDSGDEAVLVSHSDSSLRDSLTLGLHEQWGVPCGRGALLKATSGGVVEGLGLPLQGSDRTESFRPAHSGITGAAGRTTAVLVPSEAALGDGGIQALTVNESLKHLLPVCCAENGRPLDTDEFARLADWLEERQCFLVDMNHLEAAAATLSGNCFEQTLQKASGGR
ncbi:amylase [Tamilnaduibacter salinus]|uniref:Amylase n=1 Tax=Tamilnaduibacter salinus TaxID=1484056 RepID=A0A2A2I2I4_9GAMM|nr:PqqD family peptide modification chaperone [Tamilnaduibacter salinus]PAV25847.1 amylase [Tamilnaduibacter salinus]